MGGRGQISMTGKSTVRGGARTLASVTAEMVEIGDRITSLAMRGQSKTPEYKQLIKDMERIQRERAVLMAR